MKKKKNPIEKRKEKKNLKKITVNIDNLMGYYKVKIGPIGYKPAPLTKSKVMSFLIH